jgi:DNA recombination protein RmuC
MEFQKKVEETYEKEGREVFSLKQEIHRMMDMGKKMEEETKNLTSALKGDVKAQGNWGELVLEKILQHSGLRVGEEYILQGTGLNLKSDEGRSLRPDVIINLPDDKNIVIDSKVSLVAYDRLISATNDDEKEKAKREFLLSIKAHIDGLASKNYQAIDGLKTPDFVLMFAPIEGALSLIFTGEKDLFTYGWDKKIILVGPTTLLATLRTIAAIWKQERQHKNSLLIAEAGGKLYDKFVALYEDLEKMGDQIGKLHTSHEGMMGRIRNGRGNLMVSAVCTNWQRHRKSLLPLLLILP